jgi:pyruvate formate lyase activating enzyme
MLDIAKLAHQNGLKTVVVSSGYINQEPLEELLNYIDAYKIDFKGFSDQFYQELTVNGHVDPVLETMKTIKKHGVWLEVVNLVIPGSNDDQESLKKLILWVKDNLGTDTPLHFTAFHPDYKLQNTPPTPFQTLENARKMALDAGIKYVYTGNIDDLEGSNTYCADGTVAIARKGYFITANNLDAYGRCKDGTAIPGVWK